MRLIRLLEGIQLFVTVAALKLEAVILPALCTNHSLLHDCSLVWPSKYADCSFVT